MSVYYYRGYTIMKNSNKDSKWTTFENDDIKANTINGIKNEIDKVVGGHATSRIPRRQQNK